MRLTCLLVLVLSGLRAIATSAESTRPGLRAELFALVAEATDSARSQEAAARTARHEQRRAKLRTILQTHGWPGRDVAGQDGSQAMLALLQEECSDRELMKLAIPLLHAAATRGAASLSDLACLIDAARVGEGRLQIYGTQYHAANQGNLVRFPLEDPDGVDARRKLVGLATLRAQEEAMGLVTSRPATPGARRREGSTVSGSTGLDTARGLNSVRDPTLGMVYVHSRDDERAPAGDRPAGKGLEIKSLPAPGPGR